MIDIRKFKRDTAGGVLIHFLLACTALLVIALLYFFWYLPWTTNNNISITVPNIEGRQLSELDSELGRRKLRYEVNDSSYSADYPPLTVLKQYPQAGAKVKEGRKIILTVNSLKPPTVVVPELVDGSVINADAKLRSAELKRGRIELVAGPFNVVKEVKYKGRVLDPGERVPKGSVIDLVVMDGGSPTFTGFTVIGLPLDEAEATIRGSDLSLGTVHVVGDTTGGGVVIKQKPAPTDKVMVGDIVEIWIGQPGEDIPDEEI